MTRTLRAGNSDSGFVRAPRPRLPPRMPPASPSPNRTHLRPFVPKYDTQRVVEPQGLAGVVWRFFARTAWSSANAARPGLQGVFWRTIRILYLAASGFL